MKRIILTLASLFLALLPMVSSAGVSVNFYGRPNNNRDLFSFTIRAETGSINAAGISKVQLVMPIRPDIMDSVVTSGPYVIDSSEPVPNWTFFNSPSLDWSHALEEWPDSPLLPEYSGRVIATTWTSTEPCNLTSNTLALWFPFQTTDPARWCTVSVWNDSGGLLAQYTADFSQSVPEPSSILAMLCGAGGVGGLILRRRAS